MEFVHPNSFACDDREGLKKLETSSIKMVYDCPKWLPAGTFYADQIIRLCDKLESILETQLQTVMNIQKDREEHKLIFSSAWTGLLIT